VSRSFWLCFQLKRYTFQHPLLPKPTRKAACSAVAGEGRFGDVESNLVRALVDTIPNRGGIVICFICHVSDSKMSAVSKSSTSL
jgi:hypothetical protein